MNFIKIAQILERDCLEMIKALQNCKVGSFLLRASFKQIPELQKFTHNLEHRQPLHMPKEIHLKINKKYEQIFKWKIRNGIFCYGYNFERGDFPNDIGYGPFKIVFPIGNFEFVYSPTIFDLYFYYNSQTKDEQSFFETIDYIDSDLNKAINIPNKNLLRVSNEIMLKANSYYLIDPVYIIKLGKFIWP